jgi:hypothetical protein
MRAVMLGAVLLVGCASPREKDCKDLLPILDARDSAKLRSFRAQDPAIGDAVTAYTKKIERVNAGTKAVEELVTAMKMKSDAGAFSLSMFDASRPHAERLLALCMPANGPPECAALSRALEACITPAKDDTTTEEQLLECANGFAAVKSPEAATNESIRALAATIRDLEPFARNIGAPAKDVIQAAKEKLPKITDAQKAKPEANKAEIDLRALCPGHTRGPS